VQGFDEETNFAHDTADKPPLPALDDDNDFQEQEN
jgi:hypothetical protein